MNEMIERVAQALHLAWMETFEGPVDQTPFTMLSDEQKAHGYAQARAAIKAMREPTEEMLWASTGQIEAEANWKAMIDAALKPPS